MRPSELRTGSSATTDRRLLDGIVQMTIAATVFPRARDLEDDVNRPRPPVTVDEIDDTLRAICASLKKEFANVDPDMDDVRTGIYDAWRVYDSTLAVRETKDGREASSTSTRIIKYNLEKLKEYGCFSETRYAGKEAWQPTRRYNVLVQDIAASRIYDEVMRIQAKYAQNGDDDDRGLFDHLESNDAVRDDADIAYHRDVDGDSPSDAGLPLVDGDLGDGQMAVDFDAESSTASKTDHPLVDEHGIEYAEGYFDDEPVSIFDDDAPDKA